MSRSVNWLSFNRVATALRLCLNSDASHFKRVQHLHEWCTERNGEFVTEIEVGSDVLSDAKGEGKVPKICAEGTHETIYGTAPLPQKKRRDVIFAGVGCIINCF